MVNTFSFLTPNSSFRHKKIKMAVLKYYRVDENNKITRLRRECTNANCGTHFSL